jgi:hypothetical protein
MAPIKPTKDQRLKRMLEAGFFPRDLPPPFVAADFARYRKHLRKNWAPADLGKFASDPEHYSVPRFGRARRRFSIVNPINHFKVADLIANEWSEIRTFLKKSKVSEFKPVFDMTGERTFFNIDFEMIEMRTAELLSKYRSCFKTDISRYYHAIYTHSIPWALYGKAYCKANYKTPAFKLKLGDKLDKVVRQCQSDQTIGIPVGPDTSRVIGEIIGVGIEAEIGKLLFDFDARAIRYVDDIHIGFDERSSVDGLLTTITRAFSQFELDINLEKTTVLGVGESISPEWTAVLRRYSIARRSDRQQADLEYYFKTALYFSEMNPRDQVLVYAIKRSRSFRISNSVLGYYVSFLLRLCRKDSSCFPAVVQILTEANYLKKQIDLALIKSFIVDTIRYNAPIHNYFEVSWALFLAKALRIQLAKAELSGVFEAESSVCALLTMDLNSRSLVAGGIDDGYWRSHYNADGLKSNMWLLVYESTLKKWIPATAPCFVSAHPLFGKMLSKKISFYDVNKNVLTTKRELRAMRIRSRLSNLVFQNIERYF